MVIDQSVKQGFYFGVQFDVGESDISALRLDFIGARITSTEVVAIKINHKLETTTE